MSQTVLIVEDCEDVAASLAIALDGIAGIFVRLFPDGREALRILEDPSICIAALITDLHLPYIDGFEIIRYVRSDHRYRELPIVVVSGDSRPETLERLSKLGADAYFSKPYSPLELRHKIEGLLHAH